MSARIVILCSQTPCSQPNQRRPEVRTQAASMPFPSSVPGSLRALPLAQQKPMTNSPYCEWPRSCAWPREEAAPRQSRNSSMLSRLRKSLGFTNEDTDLPYDVEQLALFSDSPEVATESVKGPWWSSLWKYQGL